MRRGPKLEPIVLTREENNRLLGWAQRHKTSQASWSDVVTNAPSLLSATRFCVPSSSCSVGRLRDASVVAFCCTEVTVQTGPLLIRERDV